MDGLGDNVKAAGLLCNPSVHVKEGQGGGWVSESDFHAVDNNLHLITEQQDFSQSCCSAGITFHAAFLLLQRKNIHYFHCHKTSPVRKTHGTLLEEFDQMTSAVF